MRDPRSARFYPPREDSALLEPFARVPPGRTLLDIGTGSGVLGLAAARAGVRVVATDVNPHALRHVAGLARAQGLAIDLVRTDLARGLGRFDRIVANPPYLPTTAGGRDPDPWHDRALNGGPDGLAVSARLLDALPDHLAPGGAGFVVVSTVQDPGALERLRLRWIERGGDQRTVATRSLEGERLDVWELTVD